MKAIFLCFLLISQAFTLSIRNRMKVLGPRQQVAGFFNALLKNNVKFNKRVEEDATVYEIWVYKDKDATPEETEQLDQAVETVTEDFVDHLPEAVDNVLPSVLPELFPEEARPQPPEEGVHEEPPSQVQEELEAVKEELTPQQEEVVQEVFEDGEVTPAQEQKL